MARKVKTQLDASVAERLVDTAEELYGLHGLEGVSLRQIAQAAGTSNNYAVQYHFGDAAGLIQAVYVNRVPLLEEAVAQRLARLKRAGCFGTRELLDALLRPCVEAFGPRRERLTARFMLALASTPSAARYLGEIRLIFGSSQEILDLLRQQNPHVPAVLLRERVRLATIMFLNSVFTRLGPLACATLEQDLVDNALDMAAASVAAPVGTYGAAIERHAGVYRATNDC